MLLEGYLFGRTGFPKITRRTELAQIFSCDRKTIYNEIRRGTVCHTRSDLSIVFEYNAEYAQNIADERNADRGSIPKIMLDTALSRELKRLIVDENYSPYAAVAELNAKGWPGGTRVSEKTVYNWVNEGLIHGVSRTDLPNKGVKYREKASTRRYSRAKCAEHSIENRPKEADDRKNFGHWKLDTVKGGKDTSTECLFTMTERKSRNEIARKMPDAKGKSTVEVLDGIERKIGSDEFRRVFRTMTCDGGTEFMDIEGIERSCIDGLPRTKLYFAHPYTACERGTNENHQQDAQAVLSERLRLLKSHRRGGRTGRVLNEQLSQTNSRRENPCHDIQKLLQFLTEMRGINLYKLRSDFHAALCNLF